MGFNLKKSKYKWLGQRASKELKPGVAYKAVRGVDFDCMPRSFAGQVYQAAYALGLKVTIAVFENQGVVLFAFFHPDAFLRPNMPAYPIVRKMREQS